MYNGDIEKRSGVMKKFGYVSIMELEKWFDGVIDVVECELMMSKSCWYKDKKEWGNIWEVNGDVWYFDCMLYVKFKEGCLMEVMNEVKEVLGKELKLGDYSC